MTGDSSRRRDKRAIPYEDLEGEEAFNIVVKQVAPKKSTPKRGRGSGSISGGRGSLRGNILRTMVAERARQFPLRSMLQLGLGRLVHPIWCTTL
jgi:hypothetical protein